MLLVVALLVGAVTAGVASAGDPGATASKKKCKKKGKKKCKKGPKLPTSSSPNAALKPAQVTVSPTSHDFGNVDADVSPPATFTVTNIGGVPTGAVTATIMGANPANFTVTANGCAAGINGGASCPINVAFVRGSTPGKKTGNLVVAGAAPAVGVNLSGTPSGFG